MGSAFDENLFWGTFLQYLNENYSGDDTHWAEYLRPCSNIELGVRCYMEAAWNYAWTVSQPGYQSDPTVTVKWIKNVAAVDAIHRYTLVREETPPFNFLIVLTDYQ